LSLAIGAFFAGLIFSYDPEAPEIDTGFMSVFGLFSPFFFINIGLDIHPGALISSLETGMLLLVAAVVGKALGAFPLIFMRDARSALLVGMSMAPRAEIAMVIMHLGLRLGDWAVDSTTYAAMVLTCGGTTILSPVIIHSLLEKWPQEDMQETL
jgi:Kef-type K+ transport system membrane component KefB